MRYRNCTFFRAALVVTVAGLLTFLSGCTSELAPESPDMAPPACHATTVQFCELAGVRCGESSPRHFDCAICSGGTAKEGCLTSDPGNYMAPIPIYCVATCGQCDPILKCSPGEVSTSQ